MPIRFLPLTPNNNNNNQRPVKKLKTGNETKTGQQWNDADIEYNIAQADGWRWHLQGEDLVERSLEDAVVGYNTMMIPFAEYLVRRGMSVTNPVVQV